MAFDSILSTSPQLIFFVKSGSETSYATGKLTGIIKALSNLDIRSRSLYSNPEPTIAKGMSSSFEIFKALKNLDQSGIPNFGNKAFSTAASIA